MSEPTTPPIPPERFPTRLAQLGYTAHARDGIEWIVPPVCLVPADPFKLGSDKTRDWKANDNELQRRVVTLLDYSIARFPITVAEYACFLNATKRDRPNWTSIDHLTWEDQLRERRDHPVGNISWRNAYDYAVWLTGRTGKSWRLPTEAEWEKAARCDPNDPLGDSSERVYPWGDAYDATRCNAEQRIGRTTPVGAYGPDDPEPDGSRRSGAAPCGAEDMIGNVWEWTASEYADDYSECVSQLARESYSHSYVIMRGGSWLSSQGYARAASRLKTFNYDGPDDYFGFRMVLLAGGPPAPSS